MSKKNQISFIKPAEPAFLKQFKQQAGYKEGPTVADKKREMPVDDGHQADRPDEQPQIITLKPGDLTAEEVAEIGGLEAAAPLPDEVNLNHKIDSLPDKETDSTAVEPAVDGAAEEKMVFRKVAKRPGTSDVSKTTSESGAKKPKQESVMEKVRNTSLLSFGDDEEE